MRIGGIIIELGVPEMREGLAFYRRLIGRPPDPGPEPDFNGWEIFENGWLRLREGPASPGGPIHLQVDDIDAARARLEKELGIAPASITRRPALPAFCGFGDPWGNRLGFWQRLEPDRFRRLEGKHHDAGTWSRFLLKQE